MTEDIPALIAEARVHAGVGVVDVDLLGALADVLEAEHKRAESFRRQAEHFAIRGNLAEAERAALRSAIQSVIKDMDDARAYGEVWTYGAVQERLHRAIYTKEQSNGA